LARIGINTRFLLHGKLEGFGWYTYEVTKRLVEQHPEHDFILFFDRPFNKEFIFGKNVTPVVLSPPARHPFLFILWFDFVLPKALKKYKVDVFFSPDGYLSLRTSVPQIGTIHDINFEHFPKDLPKSARWYLRSYFPKFAKKAAQILTVSEYSKQDIVGTYGVNESKVTVAWNGASELFKPLDSGEVDVLRKNYSNGKPYFLFVGSLHPRKNLKRLIKAFELYATDPVNSWELVIVGAAMWKLSKGNVEISEQIRSKIHFTGRLNAQELTRVMGAAGALAYVPYFEGFGIPLVEAMRSGIPILSGDKTSLPEVAGDAAIYCDPMDIQSIQQGLQCISNDLSLRNELIEKGLQRSELFSWDKTAEIVWECLEKEIRKVDQ
jgi:glycosyltransferase involved in cell wall biosynthesis